MKFSFFFLFIFLISLTTIVTAAVNIGEENPIVRGVNIVAPDVIIIDTNATTACSGTQVLFGNGSCGTIAGSGGIGDFSFTDFQESYDLNLTNIFDQALNTTSNVTFDNITATTGTYEFLNINHNSATSNLNMEGRDVFRVTATQNLFGDVDAASISTQIQFNGGNAFSVTSSGVTVNEPGSTAFDFRVESDNNENMLLVDTTNDRIGIGTGTPSTTLDVNGNVFTGNLTTIGNFSLTSQIGNSFDSNFNIISHGAQSQPNILVTTFNRTGGATDFQGVNWVANAFNSDSEETLIGRIQWIMDDVTAGTEDGSIQFEIAGGGGTISNVLVVSGNSVDVNQGGANIDFTYENQNNLRSINGDASTNQLNLASRTAFIQNKNTGVYIENQANVDHMLIIEQDNPSVTGDFLLMRNSTQQNMISFENTGDVSFFNFNGDDGFFWDADEGRVGIGVNTPSFPLTVFGNTTDQNITIWSAGNISATGYITRTTVFDTSKDPRDFIRDSSFYLDDKGNINHSKYYGSVIYTNTDYSRPVIEEIDEFFYNDTTNETESFKINITLFPFKIEEQGVMLDMEIDLLRQGLFDLIQDVLGIDTRVTELETENQAIKDCTEVSRSWEEYQICIEQI